MRTRLIPFWKTAALSVALAAGLLGITVRVLRVPPGTATSKQTSLSERIVLTIGADGRVFLSHREIARSELVASLVSEMRRTGQEDVLLRGHRSVNLVDALGARKAIQIAKARLWLE